MADVTVFAQGTVAPDGAAIYGETNNVYDAGGATSSNWSAMRRTLRTPPFTVSGEVRSAREQVYFAFWAPSRAKVRAEVFAERDGSALDAVLDLLGSNAETILASDDDTFGLDSLIADYVADQVPQRSQVYYLRVSGFGNSAGPFRVRVTLEPVGIIGAPWKTQGLGFPASANGRIEAAGEADVYALDLTANTRIVAEVIAKRQGSTLDPVLKILAPDGITELAINDDAEGLGQDSRIQYAPPLAGRYFLVVQGFDGNRGGPDHVYTLRVDRATTPGTAAALPMGDPADSVSVPPLP